MPFDAAGNNIGDRISGLWRHVYGVNAGDGQVSVAVSTGQRNTLAELFSRWACEASPHSLRGFYEVFALAQGFSYWRRSYWSQFSLDLLPNFSFAITVPRRSGLVEAM